MLPKIILTDIDGVWTDGGMYYDQNGNEWKRFNTYDSFGVLLCKEVGILTGIITGENTEIVKRRSDKLKIDFLFQGVKNKLSAAESLCKQTGMKLSDIAYIGDDIGDYHLLKNVSFSGAPNNSPEYIKNIVNYVTKTNGGCGAFREFVEHILFLNGTLDTVIQKLLEGK